MRCYFDGSGGNLVPKTTGELVLKAAGSTGSVRGNWFSRLPGRPVPPGGTGSDRGNCEFAEPNQQNRAT